MRPAIFRDVAMDIVLFPVWWYSRGLALMSGWCLDTAKGYARYLAIGIWIKNIFVPMFGQNDWQSRLISIFMRSVQIVGRSMALTVISLGVFLLFAVYIVIPVVIVVQITYHVFGSLTYVS